MDNHSGGNVQGAPNTAPEGLLFLAHKEFPAELDLVERHAEAVRIQQNLSDFTFLVFISFYPLVEGTEDDELPGGLEDEPPARGG